MQASVGRYEVTVNKCSMTSVFMSRSSAHAHAIDECLHWPGHPSGGDLTSS